MMIDDNDSDTREDESPHGGQPPRRPGKLQGRIDTKFHTGEAVALVDGRGSDDGKSRIIGLKSFAKRSHLIMTGSEREDPFADYALVQIEHKLDEVTEYMRTEGGRLRDLAKERLDPGVTPESRVAYETTTWSVSPIEEEFILGQYASRALYCLIQYDELVLVAKGLQHHQVITKDECRQAITTAGNQVRGLLALGSNYAYCGCTREDLRAHNRAATDAVKKLVECRFVDPRMFNDEKDVMDYFASYDMRPRYRSDPEDAGSAPDSKEPAAETAEKT